MSGIALYLDTRERASVSCVEEVEPATAEAEPFSHNWTRVLNLYNS